MLKRSELCVVGEEEMIAPFRAAGMDVYPLSKNPNEDIESLIKNDYKIIFFPEDILKNLSGIFTRLKGQTFPLLISLPSSKGKGESVERIKEIIKKAVGIEVYWEEE